MKKPPSDLERKRRLIWKHNSFLGHTRMMIANAKAIKESETATEEAKDVAQRIEQDAFELNYLLTIKRNPL